MTRLGWLAVLRAGVASLVALCWTAGVLAEGQRWELHVFRYAATDTPENSTAFGRFQEVVGRKIQSLGGELEERVTLPALGRLRLVPALDEQNRNQAATTYMSVDQFEAFWTQHRALALLSGRMQKHGDAFQVRTSFYLGGLHGTLPGRLVTIDLPVRDDEFDNTRDSHSAMVLYALAMDSLDDCGSRAGVTAALGEALVRAEEAQKAFRDFAGFRAAIGNALQKVKERCS